MAPLFYGRLYNLVDDQSWDSVISWGESNNSFVIWNLEELISRDIFPELFSTSFTDFMFMLDHYGFREMKRSDGLWEFGNNKFVRGKPELMDEMHLKVATARIKQWRANCKPRPRRPLPSSSRAMNSKEEKVTNDLQNLRI